MSTAAVKNDGKVVSARPRDERQRSGERQDGRRRRDDHRPSGRRRLSRALSPQFCCYKLYPQDSIYLQTATISKL
jgi:hypothetical protein